MARSGKATAATVDVTLEKAGRTEDILTPSMATGALRIAAFPTADRAASIQNAGASNASTLFAVLQIHTAVTATATRVKALYMEDLMDIQLTHHLTDQVAQGTAGCLMEHHVASILNVLAETV